MKLKCLMTIALLLVLNACVRERVEPLSDQMKTQLALLPQEAEVIGYINVEQIQHSALAKTIMDSVRWNPAHNQEYEEFKSATGFDFQKDAQNIYFALGLSGEKKGLNGLFVVKGHFAPDKIMAFINSKDEKKEIMTEVYKSFNIYQAEEKQTVFCFPDSNTLIGGRVNTVKTWLDKYSAPGHEALSPDWQKRLEEIKYKNGLWLVMNTEKFTELLEKNSSLPKNFQGFKNIKSGFISMDFSEKLSFYGQGECQDKEKADLLTDAIKGLLATAKLAVSEDRNLVDIINKVRVQTNQEKITVQFQMSTGDIEKIMEKRKAHSRST